MSGVFRFVGQVAAIAALIPGPHQAIAAAVAAASTALAQVTAKRPGAQGSSQNFLVGANQRLPYVVGEAYTEGVELYKVGYGGTINDVKNPYAFLPRVLSCCGPVESIGPSYVNFAPITFAGSVGSVRAATGYYADYLWIDEQLGARPESDALRAPSLWGTPPNWSTAHKLSGFAAVGWSLKWSKKAKRFAGGQIPPLGKVVKGVKVYDPRADSTFPGGSGSQRITDESTWTYSANPALHAITYAYGRIMNGKPIFGVRLFDTNSINLAQAVAWANVCDANGWTVNGTIYEPGDKWNNLKRICEAGGAQPVPGAVLGFEWHAPRTSLYTVTKDDLAGAVSASLGKGWKSRHNVLVPRFRSAAHQWGYVQAARVQNSAWITADGEEKIDERQWDLVTDKDQVTELALYDLWQRREAGPFVLPCKPHMRVFRPGQCITLAEELGAHPDGQIKVVIRRRSINAIDGTVTLTCEMETDAKHTAALGATGTAPPVITWPDQEELDDTIAVNTSAANLIFADGDTTLEDLKPAEPGSDVTATAQRSIVPQFTNVIINQGDPGSSGDRLVLHTAKRGSTTLGGGTWSIPARNLGAGTASVNASTGTVTLSGIVQSGTYTIRYTHSDSIATNLVVNVTFVAAGSTSTEIDGPVGLLNLVGSTFAPITFRNLQVTLPGGSTSVDLSAIDVELRVEAASPEGVSEIEMRWMRESSPGTWTAVGSVETSFPSPESFIAATTIDGDVYDTTLGAITVERTATGLTAGSTQKFRLEGRVSSGPVRTIFISGTASAAA